MYCQIITRNGNSKISS